jgi:hypothetical protein
MNNIARFSNREKSETFGPNQTPQKRFLSSQVQNCSNIGGNPIKDTAIPVLPDTPSP